MAFVLLYVITGAAVARCLEKRNYRYAVVCHAVAFTVGLLYISFIPGFSAGAELWSRVIGGPAADAVRGLLFGSGDTAMAVVFALAAFTLLQTVGVAAILTRKLNGLAVKLARRCRAVISARSAACTAEPVTKYVSAERRYITLCSWLC